MSSGRLALEKSTAQSDCLGILLVHLALQPIPEGQFGPESEHVKLGGIAIAAPKCAAGGNIIALQVPSSVVLSEGHFGECTGTVQSAKHRAQQQQSY
jgi:hypothetical protein